MDFNYDSSTISSVLVLDPGTNALTISGTTGVILPAGTTAQRTATFGTLRVNTDTSTVEWYNGASWASVGSPTGNLAALAALNGTGFVTQTGTNTFAERAITGTAGTIAVTNGNGVSGNPTITLATAGTAGTYTSVTTDSYGRVTSGTTTQAWSTLTGTPTTLAGYAITDAVKNNGGAVSWQSGTFASRPAAGTAGRFYFATDTNATYFDNGTAWILNEAAITGDISIAAGSTTATLATVNSNVGSFGSTSVVPVITVNAKGLITAVSTATITPAAIGAVPTSQLGAANGVATLDSTGHLTTAQIPVALVGAMVYQGVWNASTNTPTITSGVGTKGQYYKVSVAGSTTVDGQSSWSVGDMIVFNGTTWDAIDGLTTEVTSVFGRVGAVTATLASSDFANQGTTTQFLKGNAAGNPAWSSVSLTTDVSGVLQAAQHPALTGDVTSTAGSLATTLATVNSNVGTFGSATSVPVITVNAKGLVTSVTTSSISGAISVTGGDITMSGTTGSAITNATLATVNSTVGTFGSDNAVPIITVNAKGLVTYAGNVSISAESIGAVVNAGNTPSIQSGTFAARPAAGTAGRLYVSSDTNAIYRDTGAAWVQISEQTLVYTENATMALTASTVSGANAVSIGSGNTANGTVALATGSGASTSNYGAEVRASGSFAAAGDAQSGKYVLRNSTTTATQTELFLDGSSSRIVLPNNTTMAFEIQVVGRRTDVTGSRGGWTFSGVINRDGTASTTALIGNRSRTTLTKPPQWDVDVYADATNGALTVKVTGVASQTIRWVATVTTTEVSG